MKKINRDLEAQFRYQEIYIRYLENELLGKMTEDERQKHADFEFGLNYINLFYNLKFKALCDENELLNEKLKKIAGSSFSCEIFDSPIPDGFPSYWSIPKVATINLLSDPTLPENCQVILKALNGKDQFGCALYLENPKKLSYTSLGYLIEFFFYKILPLKFKNLSETVNSN